MKEARCARCGGVGAFLIRSDASVEELCASCADRQFSSFRPAALKKSFGRPRRLDGTCPFCGWTEEQLLETSLVGCPVCYEALDLRVIPGMA